ncbi:polysaccharide pyruvyl transferase CsaB [Synergistales bacterium]|nr:polysaccharide pyruvyl transferase CsaB [Synergistales bacterium]
MKRYQVAIAGYYGFGNLGDELLARASVEALLRHGVERKRIVILSNDPEDSMRNFGIEAVNRWSLIQVSRAIKHSDTLLFGGGGLFQDTTSVRSCFYYWGLVKLALRWKVKIWALGQSVGPLTTRTGRTIASDALGSCHVLHLRDKASLAVCEALKIHPDNFPETDSKIELGCDMTLLLADHMLDKMKSESAKARFLVNIRPCPANKALPEQFALAISLSALKNAEENAGKKADKKTWKNVWRNFGRKPIKSPSSTQESLRGIALWDADLCGVALADEDEQIMSKLIENGILPPMPIERVRTLDDAARVWRGANGAAGMRLHFAILSAMAEVPLLVVPYAPKVEAFAKAYDVPMWSHDEKLSAAPPLPVLKVPTLKESVEHARQKIEELCQVMLDENAEIMDLA